MVNNPPNVAPGNNVPTCTLPGSSKQLNCAQITVVMQAYLYAPANGTYTLTTGVSLAHIHQESTCMRILIPLVITREATLPPWTTTSGYGPAVPHTVTTTTITTIGLLSVRTIVRFNRVVHPRIISRRANLFL